MAIVKLNPGFSAPRGAVGKFVFKHYEDKVVLTRKPRFENRVFSPAQLAAQQRFRQAMLQAKAALADPHIRLRYEQLAKAKGKPILSLMVADLLRSAPGSPQLSISNSNTPARQEYWWQPESCFRESDYRGRGMRSLCLRADANHAFCASRRFWMASSGVRPSLWQPLSKGTMARNPPPSVLSNGVSSILYGRFIRLASEWPLPAVFLD